MNQSYQQAHVAQSTKDVLKPILYADIFDFPLMFEEIYRFLEVKISRDKLRQLLDEAEAKGEIIFTDGYFSLPDKGHLSAKREHRAEAAQYLWAEAIRYGRWIAALPFVKMVAITGSLSVDNPRDGQDDIDYLIVTRANRLWLCRALTILIVRTVLRRGITICPNYMLTERALTFKEYNLFTARELVQMVPIFGEATYREMREQNQWTRSYLPQGQDLNLARLDDALSPNQQRFKRLSELIFGGFLGNLAERILQKKQIVKHTKLARQYGALDKVIFTADRCKGHYDSHGYKTLEAYRQRVKDHQIEGNYALAESLDSRD